MPAPRRRQNPAQDRPCGPQLLDEDLLARAAAINELVASEFAERTGSPREHPLLQRMAELGVETDAAVSVALQRAHHIAFCMRHGQIPRDADELNRDAPALSPADNAQIAGLAVAWWDGVLTVLRACQLQRREHEPE